MCKFDSASDLWQGNTQGILTCPKTPNIKQAKLSPPMRTVFQKERKLQSFLFIHPIRNGVVRD